MAEIKKISTELQLLDKFLDTSGSAGSSGSVLTSTTTGTSWVSAGTPGTGVYLPLAGGTMTGVTQFNDHTQHGDQVSAKWGAGNDFTIKHNATDSFVENQTGHLSIVNYANDKDIVFWGDDGTGGISKYLVLEGVSTNAYFSNPGNVGIGTTSPGSKLTVNGSFSADTGFFSNALTLSSDLRLQNNITILNKAQTAYISFATRNTTGSEVVMDLTNVGSINGGAAGPYLPLTGGTLTGALTGTTATFTGTVTAGSYFLGDDTSISLATTGAGTVFLRPNGQSTSGQMKVESSGNATFAGSIDTTAVNIKVGSAIHGTITSSSNSLTLNARNTGIMLFQSGGAEKMRIDSSGNVGIGTSSPDSLLELQNSPAAQTQTRLLHIDNNPASNQGSGYMEISSGTNNQAKTQIEQVSSGGFGLLGNQYLDTNIINKALSASTHGNINFATGSNTSATSIVMTIGGGSQKGNIGIGTTSPGFALDVHGDSTAGVMSVKNAANARDTFRSENAAGTRTFNIGNDASGHANVLIRNSSGTTTSYLAGSGNSYFNAGNVGIGTSSPARKLNIYGDVLIESLGFTSSLYFRPSATYAAGGIQTMKVIGSGNPFHTTISFSNYTADNVLNIVHNKVGIGTTSPTAKLHVVGTGTQLGTSGYYHNTFLKDDTNSGVLLGGNNTSNGVGFLAGINELAFLTFGTSWGERMRITGSGNVGIGTTSPATYLQIGDYPNNNINITTYPDVPSEHMIHLTAPETTNYYGGGISFGENAFTAANITVQDAGGNGSLNMLFGTRHTSGTVQERMRITSDGNVGIGTTSPTTRLHLADSNTVLTIESTTNGQNCSTWYKANGNNQWETGCNIGSGTDYQIYDRLNSASRMVVGHNGNVTIPGNVGIGTTSPGSKLQVAGEIRAADGNKGTPSYTFTSDTNTGMYSDTADQLEFVTGGNVGMVIDSSSNVGIGTNGPGNKLEVTGIIEATVGDTGGFAYGANPATKQGLMISVSNTGGDGFSGAGRIENTSTTNSSSAVLVLRQTNSASFSTITQYRQGSGTQGNLVGFVRVTTTNTIFSTSGSDERLKKNITNWTDDTLGKFKALQPKKFRYKIQDASEEKTLGFIAQNEVANFPEAYVLNKENEDDDAMYSFNPMGMTTHLMKAIKDLVEKVETLENKITQLENNN